MKIRVQSEDFDLGQEVAVIRQNNPQAGALVSFLGVVREFNENQAITGMTLEHYPGMTEKQLEKIVLEAKQRWQIDDSLIIHRIGKLLPNDQIVLVVVASAHRQDAFLACEFMMDFLKTQAPFWKKEQTADCEQWVTMKQDDEAAAKRWKNTAD